MEKAAGILFITPDDKVLLMKRNGGEHHGMWATPGGGIEKDETAEDAAIRETIEETGQTFNPSDLHPFTHRVKDGVDFTTFVYPVEEPFGVTLNDEHSQYAWVDRQSALDSVNLHPGMKVVLMRPDMDELGIARAIKEGELQSPQRVANISLIAIRITGTGASYRKSLKEYVWRDPSFYLNDEFLARCNGLPVILEHPDNGKELNGEEFRTRIIGTVFLPYIRGNDIWGIAKIYDDAAAEILENEELSTSPMVSFTDAAGNQKYDLGNKQVLLIEGRPSLLDHVAICLNGVWDKAGINPPGVQNQLSEEAIMADHEEKRSDETIEGDKKGEVLDSLLEHMGKLADSVAELHKRMDSMSRKDEEGLEIEEEGEPEDLEVADSKRDSEEEDKKEERKDSRKADSRRKDEDEEEKEERKDADGEETFKEWAKEEEEEPEHKKDSRKDSRADSEEMRYLRKKIADMEKRIPQELSEDARAKFVDAQQKAERVAQAYGDSAPRWLNGESLKNYRVRLLKKYQSHSKDWNGADLSKITDATAFDIAERAIYADAWDAALRPAEIGSGRLREVSRFDQSGRKIQEFYGDPGAAWDQFKTPARNLTGFNLKH